MRRGKCPEVLHQAVQVSCRDLFVIRRHGILCDGAGCGWRTYNGLPDLIRRAPRSHSVQRRPDVSAFMSKCDGIRDSCCPSRCFSRVRHSRHSRARLHFLGSTCGRKRMLPDGGVGAETAMPNGVRRNRPPDWRLRASTTLRRAPPPRRGRGGRRPSARRPARRPCRRR